MKKQKITSISLKFDKKNIASLNNLKGGGANLSGELACYTKVLDECHTVIVRSDSIDM